MSYIGPQDEARFADDYPVTGTDWQSYVPTTPMMLDILAIQRLYGVATTGPLASGGQIFGFHSNIKNLGSYFDFNVNNHPVVTIWDGGPHNTLDLSGFSQDAVINMHPGTFSSAAGLKNNIGIAFGTMVDTAIGGSGNDKIIASDVNSTLIGGPGKDTLMGGTGDDILTGGPDPDKIDGGGGHDLVRDRLANMNNDEILHFGLATTLEAQGALVGRDQLLVATDPDGNTTLGLGGTEVLLAGGFIGGDFMAAARDTGDVMHTDVQFVPHLPQLFEGVSVSPDAVNGITNTPFMTGDGVVKFSVTLQAAISAFDDSIGYYTVGSDGAISSVNMLFADTHGSSGATVNLPSVGNGMQVAFFLVQNGYNQFGNLPHDLSFVTQNGQAANANGGQPIFLDSASLGLLNGATVFHSIQELNPGDALQVLSGSASGGKDLQVGFEDLPRATGDNDFQDVVIQIHTDHDGVLLLG
jgi:serralysin